MSFEPFEDRVVIKQDKAEEVTEGGIYVPDAARDVPFTGIVLLVGPGKYNIRTGKLDPMNVKPGDKVLFFRHAGTPMKIGDSEYLVMNQQEIMGRFLNEQSTETRETQAV